METNRFITVGQKLYRYTDNDFDKFFQDILIENPEYTLQNNHKDIVAYFANNIETFFDDIPVNEDTDYSDVVGGFNEYIDWLLSCINK